MTNTLHYSNQSIHVLIGVGLITVLALTLLFAIPQARAESPNILVGPNMTVGSTGQGVVVLQGLLSELGYLTVPTGVPLGYYGGLTRNAVARYQAARGVAPAVGYYGPITKTAMSTHFAGHDWLSLLNWD